MPAKFAVCGLLLAASLTLNCPFRVPLAVGVKVTPIVQLLLAAKLVVHVFDDTEKSPVVEIEIPVKVSVSLLVSVNVFAGLVVPTVQAV